MAKLGKVVRVYFMDDSHRTFSVDPGAGAEALRQMVVEKIELKEDAAFALFEKRGEVERVLEVDERPVDITKAWEIDEKSDKKAKKQDDTQRVPENRFVWKKKLFLKEDEKELADPVARNLVYIQAVRCVMDGTYACSIEEVIKLAGLQVQAVYGDHNTSSHVVGFLTQNLRNFVPEHMWTMKKPVDWETVVLKEHSKNKGTQQEDAKFEYVQHCKNWPFYGTTFFPPCKPQLKSLPNKVIVGINYEGIHLYKKGKGVHKELISEHLFTEICSWASSSTHFAFEYGNQNESVKYSFDTKQGPIIAATIQLYIDILVQMLKSCEDDDEPDTTDSSADGDSHPKKDGM